MTWGKKHIALSALGLSIMSLSAPSLEAQSIGISGIKVQVTPFTDNNAENRSGRSQAPKPRGNIDRWITTNHYPSRALREGRKGSVALLLTITAVGRVSACEVTRSSGHEDLDRAACKNIMVRARFVPQFDYNGRPIRGLYPLSVRFSAPPLEEIKRAIDEAIIWEPQIVYVVD